MRKNLKRYFFTGLFVLLPIGATALIVTWMFNLMDSWATPLTQRLFGHHVPGLGLIITATLIISTGMLSSNVIGRWILRTLDHLFLDVPIFKSIYNTTKQVLQVFSPESQNSFRSVVLVEHPQTEILSIGFVTHELKLNKRSQEHAYLAVYIPTNHVYLGDIFLFRPEQVHATSLTVQEGVQSVISAGAALPPELITTVYSEKNKN